MTLGIPWFALLVLLVLGVTVAVLIGASARRWIGAILTVLLVVLCGLAVVRVSWNASPVRQVRLGRAPPLVHARDQDRETTLASSAPAAGSQPVTLEAEDTLIALDTEAPAPAKAARPAWVDRKPTQVGEAYQVSVASGPQEKLGECAPALDEQLKKAVAAYVDEYLGPGAAGNRRASDVIAYDLGYIKKHLVKAGSPFEEKLQMSFGPMYQTYALLEFGPAFRHELDARRGDLERYALEVARAYRLRGLALGFAAVLGLLAVVFSYLRLDAATRGSYRGRLRFLAATAILIVMVAGTWLARSVMWM